MGRLKRHGSRTGDGGGHLRAMKRGKAKKVEEKYESDLVFHDDPSEEEDQLESDNSEDDEDVSASAMHLEGVDDTSSDDDMDSEDENNFNQHSDDEDDNDSELERVSKVDKEWGESRGAYYDADEIGSDEDAAEDEEKAALELQRKQVNQLDEDDFKMEEAEVMYDEENIKESDIMDTLANIPLVGMDNSDEVEKITKDLSKLSKSEKMKILSQRHPELRRLLKEFWQSISELRDNIQPSMKKILSIHPDFQKVNEKPIQLLQWKERLLLNYCYSVAFYLMLVAKEESTRDHPVFAHLLTIKQEMGKFQALYPSLSNDLDRILKLEDYIQEEKEGTDEDEDDELQEFFGISKKEEEKIKPKRDENESKKKYTEKLKRRKDENELELKEAEEFYNAVASKKSVEKKLREDVYGASEMTYGSDDDETSQTKRGATYEMMKNRGLTAYKKRINRNPRVKKRLQYRKAVIRRKGQIRDVRTGEAGYYGGESTGIKSNITRSRKINN